MIVLNRLTPFTLSTRGNRLSLPFGKDPRKFYKIGVDFSSETRGIKEWKIIPDADA